MLELKLSNNPIYQAFTQRAMCYIATGGADFGECLITIKKIADGNVDKWYQEWIATASRVENIGDTSLKNGHRISACEAYLRASNYYHTSYFPLFGCPGDSRLIRAFNKEVEVFQKAALLFKTPIEIIEIPFESTTLPAYFLKVDDSGNARPTIIYTNGYDSNIQEMYFAHADAALKRGYNCLLFDGPGQGRNLIQGNSYLRPDWEKVVTPVIDYALTRKEVDQTKIILAGWSFGGFLAPRAAAYEHRIAALIADPGQWDAVDSLNTSVINKISSLLNTDEMLHWRIVQRGFWALNVNCLEDFFKSMENFKVSHIAQNIRCPTLITLPEGDPIASGALALYKALNVSNKKLVHFSEEEGSGGHCEMLSRSLYNQRVFDWLDETI